MQRFSNLLFPASVALLFILTASLQAQSRRGLITSSTCPFSCADAGVPETHCEARQRGNICEIEDFSQAPGHRTLYRDTQRVHKPAVTRIDPNDRDPNLPHPIGGRRGLITTGQCPLTCASLHIPAEECREWHLDNRCFVEDFRQPAGHQSVYKVSE